MATLLQHLYENDKRALMDWVSCNSDCGDCRARMYCDQFTAQDEVAHEWEWLMSEWDAVR